MAYKRCLRRRDTFWVTRQTGQNLSARSFHSFAFRKVGRRKASTEVGSGFTRPACPLFVVLCQGRDSAPAVRMGLSFTLLSLHPARRQLLDRIPHQLQPHSPILTRAGLVLAIAAHIQGAVKSFPDAAILPEVTPPHAHFRRRWSLRRPPQQLTPRAGKLLVSRQR